MENDLISRSALKDEILSWCVCITKPSLLSKDDTMYIVENAPTVDAVEVVRCGNCIHRVYKEIGDCEIGGCELLGVALPCDFYCAEGERRAYDGK